MKNIIFGFEFGIGFFTAFAIVITFIISRMKRASEKSMRKKLTVEMLESYKQKLLQKNDYEEADKIKNYIERFKTKDRLNDFFEDYKIDSRLRTLEESEEGEDDENLFGSFKRVYFIKPRN